jgi:hypothetical protein
MIRDTSLDQEARRYLLKGQGEYRADGQAADWGYVRVVVRQFGAAGVDVWFYRANDPCNSRARHVEFGRTGGEMLLEPGEILDLHNRQKAPDLDAGPVLEA